MFASSQDLQDSTLAAWDEYTASVNLDLDDVEPVNLEIADDNTIVVDSDSLADQSPLTDLGESENDDSTSPLWWFVGIGAVLLLWYVLWRRPEEQQTP